LGDFSPLGHYFGHFLITEVGQISGLLFTRLKGTLVLTRAEICLGDILGDFLADSSGHPDRRRKPVDFCNAAHSTFLQFKKCVLCSRMWGGSLHNICNSAPWCLPTRVRNMRLPVRIPPGCMLNWRIEQVLFITLKFCTHVSR
jgi:hypothetical protein